MKTPKINQGTTSAETQLNTTKSFTANGLKWFTPFAMVFVLYSCSNNNQIVQQYKTLHEHDSLLMAKTQSDDSAINGYMHNLNDIQSTLDDIKTREKIMRVNGQSETHNGNTAVGDIKAIDSLIIKSNHEIAALHSKMKKMNKHDAELEAMVARLSTQLAQQDTEITTLQNSLARVNTSYVEVTRQFNDSITVLQAQNSRIQGMTVAMNTVYYAIGTEKELKENKIITKSGGFVGIGKNSELTPDKNTSYFTKTDLTTLNALSLNAKFKKLLSTHPAGSYKISGNKTADSLIITDKSAFWSEDKFLVIAVK